MKHDKWDKRTFIFLIIVFLYLVGQVIRAYINFN